MPKFIAFFAALLLTFGSLYAETSPDELTPETQRLLNKMNEPYRFNASEANTLEQVLEIICKESQIDVLMDWDKMEEQGITRTMPAKLRLPIALPLNEVFRYLGEQTGVSVSIQNDKIHLIPPVVDDGQPMTIYYKVDDLLDDNDKPDFETLVDYIETMVAPGSWSKKNGEVSAEAPKLGDILADTPSQSLVIRQTREVHKRVQECLGNLRRFAKPDTKLVRKIYDVRDLAPEGGVGNLDNVIQSECHRNSWGRMSGPGSIFVWNQRLIITNTKEVHQDIAELLGELRKLEEIH